MVFNVIKYNREYQRNRRKRDPEYHDRTNKHIRLSQKIKRINNRRKLFNIIGGAKCLCKGKNCWHKGKCKVKDYRVLQIDHIKGGGYQEVKNFKGNLKMVEHYINRPKKAKKKLQPLCANCNWCKKYNNKEI